MQRVVAIIVAAAFWAAALPALAGGARAGQAPVAASISGTASSSAGQVMANAAVQLRNLATGQLAGTTTSSAAGEFSFIGLNPGNYVIEVVNAAGQIVGTSTAVSVAAGAAVTGVSVTASAAAMAAGAAAGAAAGGVVAAGASTAAVVTAAAAAAGVIGIIVPAVQTTASPSR